MSDSDRIQRQRRRSQRIRRQSLAVPPPPYAFDDQPNSPNDDTNQGYITSAAYVTQAVDGSNCGSFWVEVDEPVVLKKTRSRRSSIGVHLLHPLSLPETSYPERSPCHYLSPEDSALQTSADSFNIEVLRKPFPEADMSESSMASFVITDEKHLGSSLSSTPQSMAKSLPFLATPKSLSDRFIDSNNGGSALSATSVDGRDLNVTCPMSCEDDTDDSLLICTPDLSRFHKNIHFKCAIDFSEIDQTPTIGDDSDDHESPIVSYSYHKLKSSDVVRRRRSTSMPQQGTSPVPSARKVQRKRGTPRNLLPSCDETETETNIVPCVSPVNSGSTTYAEPHNRPSLSDIEMFPTSVSHLNVATEDLLIPASYSAQDRFSVSSFTHSVENYLQATRLSSPAVSQFPIEGFSTDNSRPTITKQSVLDDSHENDGSRIVAVELEASLQPEHEQINVKLQQSDTCSGQTDGTGPDLRDPGVLDDVQNGSLDHRDDAAGACLALPVMKPEQMVEQTFSENSHTGTLISDTPIIPCYSKSNERSSEVVEENAKGKERNLAADVCKIFRSLAKRLSGSAKKKRKSITRSGKSKKSTTKSGGRAKATSSSAESDKSTTWSPKTEDGFTFRKIQKFLDPPSPVKESTPEMVVVNTPSPSLDFSPFLPPAETSKNVREDVTHSPILKLHHESCSITESNENAQNVDESRHVIANRVLSEKSKTELAENEIDPRRKGSAKRKSLDAQMLLKECEEFMAKEQDVVEETEEGKSLRRSRRSRRSSLEIFRYASHVQTDIPEVSDLNLVPSRSKKGKKTKNAILTDENLEDLYRNKNYKLPTERTWETLFESPDKCKNSGMFQSRRKYRRTICFEGVNPAKMRRRLQKAATRGWDVTGRKRKNISLEDVKNKMDAISAELSPQI